MLTVDWEFLPKKAWGGQLLGYRIAYKKFVERNFTVKRIHPGYQTSTLTGLKPHTLYWVEVNGYNSAGEGPVEYDVMMTQQGVPSVLVPGVQMWSKQDSTWWALKWEPLPEESINGVLLGYKIIYHISYRAGVMQGGELKKTEIKVNNLTYYKKVTGLVPYARYDVTVAGFTIAGDGPTQMKAVETCNCAENIYISWYEKQPYVTFNTTTNKVGGFFPPMIEQIFTEVCGTCKDWNAPNFYYTVSKTGENPIKQSEYELKRDISQHVDVSLPIYGQDGRYFVDNSLFFVIVPSSGCSLIVRSGKNPVVELEVMINGIMNVWPFILITYIIACAFGSLAWFVGQNTANEDFTTMTTTHADEHWLWSLYGSVRGIGAGMWWAFVTMTTMGYGDKINASVPGRIVSIGWQLTGIALNGIAVGSVITSLYVNRQAKDPVIYNTKTAAIYNSFEYVYAINHNAIVDPEVKYTNVSSMIEALADSIVDIVIIDSFNLVSLQSTLKEKNLRIVGMIDTKSGYGIVLGGNSTILTSDIKGQILVREAEITQFIATNMKNELPRMEKSYQGEGQEDIFAADAIGFRISAMSICIVIAILVVFGVIYQLWRWRKKWKVENIDNNMNQLKQIEDMVDEFYSRFTRVVEETEIKHRGELFQLYTKKKAYNALVKEQGKKNVDRKILISGIQAQRRAAIRQGVGAPVHASQWLELNEVSLQPEYSIDNDDLGSIVMIPRKSSAAMLYK